MFSGYGGTLIVNDISPSTVSLAVCRSSNDIVTLRECQGIPSARSGVGFAEALEIKALPEACEAILK